MSNGNTTHGASSKRARSGTAPNVRVVARESKVLIRAAPPDDWVEIATRTSHVLVIDDGAGTGHNAVVYEQLRDQGYELTHVSAGSRDRSFRYPQRWSQPGHVDSTDRATLGGFGRQVAQGIAGVAHDIPSVIVCGSRGGQAVLSPIIERSWRGPVVCINAGVLTAGVPIPAECLMVFITMGRDYFATSDVHGYTIPTWRRLAEPGAVCVVLHDPEGGHMPDSRTLGLLMPVALRIAAEGAADLSGFVFPPGTQVYSVFNDDQAEIVQWRG